MNAGNAYGNPPALQGASFTFPSTAGSSIQMTANPLEVSVVGQINSDIDRLAVVIEGLEKKAHRVLSPEYAETADGGQPEPIMSDIRRTQRSLSSQIARLAAIVDRIEA